MPSEWRSFILYSVVDVGHVLAISNVSEILMISAGTSSVLFVHLQGTSSIQWLSCSLFAVYQRTVHWLRVSGRPILG